MPRIKDAAAKAIVIACLVTGAARDVLVVTNAYNGEITALPEEIEFALLDVVMACIILCCWRVAGIFCIVSSVCIPALHAQWYFHSPFREWPSWYPAQKSVNDARHRTEFYMCHAFAFSMRCVGMGNLLT